MVISRGVVLLLCLLLAGGCGGDERPSGAKGEEGGRAADRGRGPAAPPGELAPVDTTRLIAVVDELRAVVDPALFTELAVEAAAGRYDAEVTGNGVALREVPIPSILADLGLASGDVIASVGGIGLRDRAALQEAWVTLRDTGRATLKIDRRGQAVERRIILLGSLDRELAIAAPPPRVAPEIALVARALATGLTRIGVDTYDLDRAALETLGAHPLLVDGAVSRSLDGWTPDVGSPLEALGLTRWDNVTAVGGRGVRQRGARAAARPAAGPAELTIDVVRAGDPVTVRYRLVDGGLDRARLDAALAEWRTVEAEAERRAAEPPPADPTAGELDALIAQVDDHHYQVDRALIDKLLADPRGAGKGVRIVPSIKDGKPNGAKLYAIRPGSALDKLGLSNGDTVHSVNGHVLASPDDGLAIYAKVKTAKKLTLELTRRGKPVTLRYAIR